MAAASAALCPSPRAVHVIVSDSSGAQSVHSTLWNWILSHNDQLTEWLTGSGSLCPLFPSPVSRLTHSQWSARQRFGIIAFGHMASTQQRLGVGRRSVLGRVAAPHTHKANENAWQEVAAVCKSMGVCMCVTNSDCAYVCEQFSSTLSMSCIHCICVQNWVELIIILQIIMQIEMYFNTAPQIQQIKQITHLSIRKNNVNSTKRNQFLLHTFEC